MLSGVVTDPGATGIGRADPRLHRRRQDRHGAGRDTARLLDDRLHRLVRRHGAGVAPAARRARQGRRPARLDLRRRRRRPGVRVDREVRPAVPRGPAGRSEDADAPIAWSTMEIVGPRLRSTGTRSRGSTPRGSRPATRPSRPRCPSWEAWDAAHLPEPAPRRDRRAARSSAGRRSRRSPAAASTPASPRARSTSPESARGRGVGRALMEELIRRSEEAGHLDDPDGHLPRERRRASRCTSASASASSASASGSASTTARWRDVVFLERRSPIP